MPKIIGIKFKNSSKVYYFSPEGIDFNKDDGAIVETSRGVEYGRVVISNREVSESDIVPPLKPVIRRATIEDQEQYDRNSHDAEKALITAIDKLPKYNIDLKFTDVEYTFDRKKIIFYFTAPERVDFREFVRDLGATFKTRIELRQIHERDDFKMKGALAPCGRECCCSAYLNDFDKVTIKMAKVQGLSLNPQKISGLCGKLMCCLRYEHEHYKEAADKMPKEGSFVVTPDGEGRVESNDLIRLKSKVKIVKEDGVIINNYDIEVIEPSRNTSSNRVKSTKQDEKQGTISNNNNQDNKPKNTKQHYNNQSKNKFNNKKNNNNRIKNKNKEN